MIIFVRNNTIAGPLPRFLRTKTSTLFFGHISLTSLATPQINFTNEARINIHENSMTSLPCSYGRWENQETVNEVFTFKASNAPVAHEGTFIIDQGNVQVFRLPGVKK
jgi:hypothetical protein